MNLVGGVVTTDCSFAIPTSMLHTINNGAGKTFLADLQHRVEIFTAPRHR